MDMMKHWQRCEAQATEIAVLREALRIFYEVEGVANYRKAYHRALAGARCLLKEKGKNDEHS